MNCGRKKLLLFDLDGVLVSTKELHFEAFNESLKKNDLKILSFQEHLNIYDGLSTRQKIDKYIELNNLKLNKEKIWSDKQKITAKKIFEYNFYNQEIYDTFFKLKQDGYIICVCTNSIKETTESILKSLKIDCLINKYYCNENIKTPKPFPEIYWQPMIDFAIEPSNTYIFEDSPIGILSAKQSGANLVLIKNIKEIEYKNIIDKMNDSKKELPYIDINILIPMAGNGSRFQQAGYTFPKPLIDVNGKPMIQNVVDNFGFRANFIFVVRKEHREKYNLDSLLSLIAPNCKIIEVDKLTEGAACTTLLAKEFINNDKELILANSDQYVNTDLISFLYNARNKNVDISYLCFDGSHPKFSFVKTDENGFIIEAAEKKPISNIANVGIYYWKTGADFVKYTEQMISKNIRTNGEFFNSPAVNEAIIDNKKANVQMVKHEDFWCTGDPESLQFYLNNFKK